MKFNFRNLLPINKKLKLQQQPQKPKSARERRALLEQLIQQTETRVRQDINTWRSALAAAENKIMPERKFLYTLYKDLEIDNHLSDLMGIRKESVKGMSFKIINSKTGKEDKEKTKLFEQPWFFDWMDYALHAKFWGFTVIEIQDFNEKGEVSAVDRLPFQHVIPELHAIRLTMFTRDYFYYQDTPYMDWLTEVGKPDDLGLLYKVAPNVLWKKNAQMCWSEFGEIFGMPFRKGKVGSNRTEDLDRMETVLKEMGSAFYAVFQEGEEIELIESTRTDSFNVYDKLIDRCNSEMSKLILASTMIVDDGASYSQGKVHERISDKIILSDARSLMFLINWSLIPTLRKFGYPFSEDDIFSWDSSEKLPLKELWNIIAGVLKEFDVDPKYISETFNIPITGKKEKSLPPDNTKDDNKDENGDDKTDTEKKKLIRSRNIFQSLYKNIALSDFEPSGYEQWMGSINDFLKELASGKINPADLNEDLFWKNANSYIKAGSEGLNTDFDLVDYNTPDYNLIQSIQNNTYYFAGAKSYQVLRDMNDLFKDEKGNIIPYHEFQDNIEKYRKEVLGINELYNRTWLKTEYNTAIASAQSASRWAGFLENADIFPTLTFNTVGDDRVRDEHAKLEGFTAPIEDPIWRSGLVPPLDFNCRCFLTQGNAPVSNYKPDITLKDEFSFHPYYDGVVFSEKHPYFNENGIDKLAIKQRSNEFGLAEHIRRSENIYNSYDGDKNYKQSYFDNESGGYLIEHKKAQKLDKIKNADELKTIDKLITNGERVVRPQFVEKDFQSNYDFTLNGSKFEAKAIRGEIKNGIEHAIKDSLEKKQALNFVLYFPEKFDKAEMVRALRNLVLNPDLQEKMKGVNSFVVLTEDQKAVITVKELKNKDYRGLNKL